MVAQRAGPNVGADYYIPQDCRLFVVSTGPGVFPPGKHGIPAGANIVVYHWSQIGEPDAEKAIALWAADGAAAFPRAVTEGNQETAKLLRYALQYMGGESNASAPQVTIRGRLLHARVRYGVKVGQLAMKGTVRSCY
jgi:hypothetical protein